MKWNLYTNIPAAHMDYIENRVVEKLGLGYVQGKEFYNIELSYRLLPDSTVSCKCIVAKDHNNIELYKDEEINGIIGSAVVDSEIQGGLRWPFGKDSSGGRYAVIGIGHTTTNSYRNSSIRFKLWHADRFDFRSSIGEVTREIFLKMPGIIFELRVGSLSVTAIAF
ncbi:hypothetical protein HAX54_025829 [Datura stramonium]|uniref:DUF7903 domain-containing protein n=1 Tax=Datura stramonium TaxID=4076 RepID=A0ABS8V044_DATST|nr:hypothetical protein [Datura stramonium]